MAITDGVEILGNGATVDDRIVHTSGDVILRDLTISGVAASATCGGAIESDGRLTLIGVSVSGNTLSAGESSGAGGGVCAHGDLVLVDSTVAGNAVASSVGGTGGGLAVEGDLVLVGSTVSGNTLPTGTASRGGGVVVGAGSLTVVNSTVSDNTADEAAGLAAAGATGAIQLSTVAANTGATALDTGAGVTLAGSIVAGGAPGAACAAAAPPTSGGYNVVADATCGPLAAGDHTGAAALLGALADNGGPTLTRLPGTGSPAIDAIPAGTAGLCDTTRLVDQRGAARPDGVDCDAGAVEAVLVSTTVDPVATLRSGAKAEGVNDLGIVVGSAWPVTPITPFVDVAARWDSATGAYTSLGTLGGPQSSAADISDAGVIVGWAQTAAAQTHAVRWAPGIDDLGTLGGTTSRAAAVNDSGLVVGDSTTAGGATHAFVWDPATDTMSDLGTLGGADSHATDVNESGQIVGYSTTAEGATRAVRWASPSSPPTDLGIVVTGGPSRALGINDAGVVVGDVEVDAFDPCLTFGFPCPPTRGFRWTASGGFEVFAVLGTVTHASATAIDDGGTIVGYGTTQPPACSHCSSPVEAFVVDPADGSVRAAGTPFAPTAINDRGLVAGIGYDISAFAVIPEAATARVHLR